MRIAPLLAAVAVACIITPVHAQELRMTGGASIVPDTHATGVPLQFDSSVAVAFPINPRFEWFVDATASTAFAPIARSGIQAGPRPTPWRALASFDVLGADVGLAFKPTAASYIGLAVGLAHANASVRSTAGANPVPTQSSGRALLARISPVAGYKFKLAERISLLTEIRLRYGQAISTSGTRRYHELFQISPQTGIAIGF